LKAANGGTHDRPGEAEQQQDRGDVGEQEVLRHVCAEQTLLAEAVDRRDEREQEHHEAGCEGGCAQVAAARVAEAPGIRGAHHRDRQEHLRLE
jgi:hypothetical protein